MHFTYGRHIQIHKKKSKYEKMNSKNGPHIQNHLKINCGIF
jgi:hypothetical protein